MRETLVHSLGWGDLEKEWRPTPVLLPGKSHGWRSLVGYGPCGCGVGHDWATSLHFMGSQRVRHDWATEQRDCVTTGIPRLEFTRWLNTRAALGRTMARSPAAPFLHPLSKEQRFWSARACLPPAGRAVGDTLGRSCLFPGMVNGLLLAHPPSWHWSSGKVLTWQYLAAFPSWPWRTGP